MGDILLQSYAEKYNTPLECYFIDFLWILKSFTSMNAIRNVLFYLLKYWLNLNLYRISESNTIQKLQKAIKESFILFVKTNWIHISLSR